MASRRPRRYHHGDLANALVDVALELIERDGDFSLRDAAASCGVAVSAAYKHYASKQALLDAVADRGFSALADEIDARVAATTRRLRATRKAEATLVELGRTYILFALARPRLFRLMYGPQRRGAGRRDSRTETSAHRITVQLLGALQGVLAAYGHGSVEPRASMVIAWSIVHGFATLVVDGVWRVPSQVVLDQTIEAIGNAVLRSLR